ncbi:STY4851/ECs_5259 family protein [Gayadomonas joobiniege]|uniref:STY4851/ECs_5259 family protein n=1 Tax=Gayadomonas joobiniege TaxID=1234606 RepID=UPI0003696DEA|nr:STY4851/ECs_5259 family protein [Gayadomonas joobiniege]
MSEIFKPVTLDNVTTFITEFLSKRNLRVPTAAALFTYHLSVGDYSRLKSLLQQQAPNNATFKNKYWCAAFCLFSAEWYRREYRSGWTWSGIFAALGYEIDANQRSTAVTKGLNFWLRPINKHSGNRNDYLGSVYAEGGLPFGLLAEQGSRFQSLFKRLLADYDKAKTFGQSPIPLIEQQLVRMPDAFKELSTVELLHDMVSNLYGLIDTYALEQQSNPTQFLDSTLPKWRVSFPIPFDDQTGDDFLSGLLKSAAEQRKEFRKNAERLKLEQWLVPSDELTFAASITVSSKFTASVSKHDLSAPMVEVLIYEGSRQIADLGMARAEPVNDHVVLHTRKLKAQFRRSLNDADLKLVIMQAGRVCYTEEIPASAIPHQEMPIILLADDDKQLVYGMGSKSKKAGSLAVITSKNAQIELEHATLHEDSQKTNYRLLTFSGVLTLKYVFDDHGDTYEISTKEESFNKELLTITGEEFEFTTDKGYPVFKGLPKVSCDLQQTQVFLGDDELGKVRYSAGLYGRQVLRVKRNNKTLYRRKLAILPANFSMQLQASNSANEGCVKIHSDTTFIYNVTGELTSNAINIAHGKRINLQADHIPPAYFNIAIQANLLAEPIELKLPFPSKGALLFDGNGKELPRHFSVDNLLGARINLFKEAHKACTTFEIELKAPTSAQGNAVYVFNYQVDKFVEEVNLFDLREKIKELLATAESSELDEVVRMLISAPGMRTKQYTIGWFALTGNREHNILTFDAHTDVDFSGLKVELINLANPEQKSQSLAQRTSDGACIGTFELPPVIDSPKLAVPSQSSNVQFRPVFIPPTEQSEAPDRIRSLGKAAEVFHPQFNKFVFDEVLSAMATDIGHSGWRYLDCLIEKYAHLPMLTFEAFKALARHPNCLAILPFATKLNTANVLQILQTEFNIVWELIPLSLWQHGQNLYESHMTQLGLPDVLVAKYTAEKLEAICSFVSLPDLFSLNASNKARYSGLVEFYRENLLRNNADEIVRWPQHYKTQLSEWIGKNYPELTLFNVPHDFQRSIMYFPMVAAAVASTSVTWEEVLGCSEVNYFLLRQLIEFDRNWFDAVYQCSLCFFIQE